LIDRLPLTDEIFDTSQTVICGRYRAGAITTGWDVYHGSAMGSTFGVAAAAGRLMGLSPNEIIHAMGIAEIQAPNCMLMGWVQARNVPMIKEGMGWSAATGLVSAYMAQSGIRGTLSIFNDADGLSEIESLGKTFEIEHHYFKSHPGCRWSHIPLQTLQRLMTDHDITVENIREITVQANSHAAFLDNPCPSTMENAQYSIPFVIAVAPVDGTCGPKQMRDDKLSDPDIRGMAKRVCIVLEPEFDKGYPEKLKTQVPVTLNTGETFRAMRGKIRGDDNFPLSDRELRDKFSWMSSNRLDRKHARVIVDEVWSLETHTDMTGFVEMLHTMC
jgi:2-methylcitrate dehydratase PrpD